MTSLYFGLLVVKLTQIPSQCLAKQLRAIPEDLGQSSPGQLGGLVSWMTWNAKRNCKLECKCLQNKAFLRPSTVSHSASSGTWDSRCKDWRPQDEEGSLPHLLDGDLGPASIPHWASDAQNRSVTWAATVLQQTCVFRLSVMVVIPFLPPA